MPRVVEQDNAVP